MIEFKLPSLGADMDEGTLLEWRVKPGDAVKKGQVIAVVDTAKAAVDVECWQDGTVAELVAEIGQKMPVGSLMARLLEAGETVRGKVGAGGTAARGPAASMGTAAHIAGAAGTGPAGATSSTPPAAPPAMRRMISPAARKHAEELGVDLDRVVGTGPHGAVTSEDVARAASAAAKPAPPAPGKAQEMRKAIAAAMARSKREIPHYYVAEDIPLAHALAWLQAENAQRPMAERVLPAALLLKATAAALRRYPELNGYFRPENGGAFVPGEGIHLGVAITLRQGGLVAPALLDADAKPLVRLMQELTDLVQRTRSGSLKSAELGGATITVTNLGDQGTHGVFGVIYPPQVALVGFGRVAARPWVDAEGGIKAAPLVTASLSADHRVSDGHRGALFLRELADLLQRPEELAK